MSETTTISVADVLSQLPAEWHAPAREYLAAIAAATSADERAAIKQRVIDATVREARSRGWCSEAERALEAAFGAEPEGGWRDTDGYDCRGNRAPVYGADGFDQDGYDRDGYDRDGIHRSSGRDRDGYGRDGYDRSGFSREGFNRYGFNRDGLNADGFDQNGFNAEGVDKDGRSKYRFDLDGYDADGFGREGWHRTSGRNRDGFDSNGYDVAGYRADGTNRWGYTRDLMRPDGSDPFTLDQNGYTREYLTSWMAERYPDGYPTAE